MIHKVFKNGEYIYLAHDYFLSCEKCSEEYHSLEHARINDFILSARNQGWSVGDNVICPNCNKKRRKYEYKF